MPTGASASAEFITDSDGLLALKTPIKIGDRMGPDLPWAGPPPTGPPTPESALIFMRAYLASRTVSLYKMSPDPVSAYLDPGCPCARMLALIKEHSVKRQHFVGPSLVINDLHVNQVRSNKILVGVDTSQGTDHLVDDNGNEVGDDAAVSHLKATYVLDFDHAKNVWHISQALG